ncbi:MAG: CvpA family protein [Candidatus Omnitrophica bacterium]|nr:CvpA family protein [Candidatus Omnitrophota bacterium]
MIYLTDKIVVVILTIYFLIGWQRGFFKAIIGPIAFIVGTLISAVYYFETKNLIIAVIIGIIAPLVLGVIFSILFRPPPKDKDDNSSPTISFVNRAAGGLICAAWSGGMAILCIILVTLIPSNFKPLASIKKDISSSQTYRIVNKLSGHRLKKTVLDIDMFNNLVKSEKVQEDMQKSEAYKNLMDDPSVKSILNDAKTLESIQKKDIKSLIGNPKILAIMNNPDLIGKLMQFQKEIIEKNSAESSKQLNKM